MAMILANLDAATKRVGPGHAVGIDEAMITQVVHAKLKKLLAEAMLDIAVLKDISAKKW